jgi:adenylosuccinate lyase
MKAWEAIRQGNSNPLMELLSNDESIAARVPKEVIDEISNAESYIGNAATRALMLAEQIRKRFNQ